MKKVTLELEVYEISLVDVIHDVSTGMFLHGLRLDTNQAATVEHRSVRALCEGDFEGKVLVRPSGALGFFQENYVIMRRDLLRKLQGEPTL